jgi:hypothetical protein
MNVYLDDRPRSDFVRTMCSKTNCHSITIIIEGGFNTLEVIRNDLKNKRPVVIIHGSGRLANVLGTLLEVSTTKNTLEYERNNLSTKSLCFQIETLTLNSKLHYFFLNTSEKLTHILCNPSLSV